jgi:bacitracin transport system permease protein
MPNELKAEDIYKEVWHCRDFEISNLWQRSVFLGAFMLAIAAGYGTLVMKMSKDTSEYPVVYTVYNNTLNNVTVKPELGKSSGSEQQSDNTVQLRLPGHILENSAADGLCLLGMIFSILWVMMAKGSKFWYEAYEAGINYFRPDYKRGTDCHNLLQNSIFNYYSIKDAEIRKSVHNENTFPLHGYCYPDATVDHNIFTTNAGGFSVSRVNILIGMIGIIGWTVLFILHFSFVVARKKGLECPDLYIYFCAIGFGLAILAVLYVIISFSAKSSYAG